MAARHELTDKQWEILRDLLESNPEKRGRPSKTGDRTFVNAVLFVLAVGCAWRDLPSNFGPWKTVFNRFSSWTKNGLWEALFDVLRDILHTDDAGSLVDGSIIRAHQDSCGGAGGPAKNMIGKSKGGTSTKIHAVTTLTGLPLYVKLSPGQEHDVKNADDLIPFIQGSAFIADAGYDSDKLRDKIKEAGKSPEIKSSKNRTEPQPLNTTLYSFRYRVECFFHSIKRKRRIASRYEKTARNYLGMLHLVCGMLWLEQAATP